MRGEPAATVLVGTLQSWLRHVAVKLASTLHGRPVWEPVIILTSTLVAIWSVWMQVCGACSPGLRYLTSAAAALS